jgi:16S rRNA processing protein RimM
MKTGKTVIPSQMVVMGRIVAPYGVYGWLKVLPDTEALDSLFDYDEFWLARPKLGVLANTDMQWKSYSVETIKLHVDTLVVKLDGIDDRDAALACKGMQVAVPRELLPEPDDDEYYWSDLIGVRVQNQQQQDFGEIIDVFATGANDVIVVKGERERLIPFIDQVVLSVDIAAKEMLVEWDAEF